MRWEAIYKYILQAKKEENNHGLSEKWRRKKQNRLVREGACRKNKLSEESPPSSFRAQLARLASYPLPLDRSSLTPERFHQREREIFLKTNKKSRLSQ